MSQCVWRMGRSQQAAKLSRTAAAHTMSALWAVNAVATSVQIGIRIGFLNLSLGLRGRNRRLPRAPEMSDWTPCKPIGESFLARERTAKRQFRGNRSARWASRWRRSGLGSTHSEHFAHSLLSSRVVPGGRRCGPPPHYPALAPKVGCPRHLADEGPQFQRNWAATWPPGVA
jgi:hypothetical protein